MRKTKQKHSPGPWTADRPRKDRSATNLNDVVVINIRDADNWIIASVKGPRAEAKADARLILSNVNYKFYVDRNNE